MMALFPYLKRPVDLGRLGHVQVGAAAEDDPRKLINNATAALKKAKRQLQRHGQLSKQLYDEIMFRQMDALAYFIMLQPDHPATPAITDLFYKLEDMLALHRGGGQFDASEGVQVGASISDVVQAKRQARIAAAQAKTARKTAASKYHQFRGSRSDARRAGKVLVEERRHARTVPIALEADVEEVMGQRELAELLVDLPPEEAEAYLQALEGGDEYVTAGIIPRYIDVTEGFADEVAEAADQLLKWARTHGLRVQRVTEGNRSGLTEGVSVPNKSKYVSTLEHHARRILPDVDVVTHQDGKRTVIAYHLPM